MRRSLMTLIFTTIFMPVSTSLAEGTQLNTHYSGLPDPGDPLYLAQADGEPADEGAAQSEQCRAFAKDIHADLGEVKCSGPVVSPRWRRCRS